jgi:hypothetical protein
LPARSAPPSHRASPRGLAGVAVLRGDNQRCATLLGAARAHLDNSAFDFAFDQGADMTLDAACTHATTLKPT